MRRICLILGLAVLLGCSEEPEGGEADFSREGGGSRVGDALSVEDMSGYERAFEPRPLVFPRDHGAHPDFRTEWWYFTGNLDAVDGRQFGYQLTLFRIAIAPEDPPQKSAWATRQIYMGHFAVSDIRRREHHAFERFSRGAVGLAGAETAPFRVWLENWSVASEAHADGLFPVRLQAAEEDIAIDLRLASEKPPVLQGDRGLSRKSAEPGNASYYYSFTRMPSSGEVRIGDVRYEVTGLSWMDREWSTSALGEDQTGWDWFALQFDDGRELMFYRLRDTRGGSHPFSAGVLVDVEGQAQPIGFEDVALEPLNSWTSPETGDTYPAEWRLRIADLGLDLRVSPLLPDQEMNVSVRYWEGAVAVIGTESDVPVSGRGYLEMTRYE